MRKKRAPTVLATCPHCGCPIYTRQNDADGLPVPEYICQCRYFALLLPQPITPSYPTWPAYPYQPLPWWLTGPTCGAGDSTGDFWKPTLVQGGNAADVTGNEDRDTLA